MFIDKFMGLKSKKLMEGVGGSEACHSFHLLSFFFLRLLLFTHFGENPLAEISRRNIYIFFGKKMIFVRFFLLFMASVWLRSLDQPIVPGVNRPVWD